MLRRSNTLRFHSIAKETLERKRTYRDFIEVQGGGSPTGGGGVANNLVSSSSSNSNSKHDHHHHQRPAPPHKLPMLMNVAKACPPGYGGSALEPATRKFNGLRLVAAAFRAHQKVALRKMTDQQQQPNESSSEIAEFLYFDDKCLVVPDAFPKSTFHFLVLPRLDPVSKSTPFMSIRDIGAQQPEHVSLLRHMDSVGAEIVKAIFSTPEMDLGNAKFLARMLVIGTSQQQQQATLQQKDSDIHDFEGTPQTMLRQWLLRPRSHQSTQLPITKLRFMSGFHALPSLCPLHMHLTSLDLVSDSMKHKKHYNTFTTGFFLSRAVVEQQLNEHRYVKRAVDPVEVAELEKLENRQPACVWCKMQFKSMPELKEHLLKCSSNASYFVQRQQQQQPRLT